MKVGFIGLGNMGLSMASNVLAAGFELVVWNRSREKAAALESRGDVVADSPAALAQHVDIVCACLASVAAGRAVLLGEGGADGVIPAARNGQVIVDHGTVDLASSRDMAAAAKARGASFLDAPISGGPGGAADGTLSIMAGGDADAFETARPVFEAMGRTIVHMGPTGAGTATKLANQLLVGVHSVASCEALLLAEKAGVDAGKLMTVLSNSWGASRMLERNAPVIVAREYELPGAPIRNLLKDLRIITELGRELGLDIAAARQAEAIYARLVEMGRGEWDVIAPCSLIEPDSCEGGAT